MKKLAKLSAVFTVICMALALGACSHSGSDYDWKKKNPGSSDPTNPEAEKLLTLTNEWDGTYVFYDDGTFTYESSDGETKTRGTYEGDASSDNVELRLSVTSGDWGDGWKEPDNDYGIYFEIEGESVTGYDWYMEDGEEVKSESPKTFTKVEEAEEPGSGSGGTTGTTEDEELSYVASKEDYYGTWEIGGGYKYFVIEEDNTFYYFDLKSKIDASKSYCITELKSNDGPNKGTWEYDEESNTMKLSKKSWYDSGSWNTNGM